jgi:site-specific DNA-methyltransferase (adenine-specific)
MKINKIYKGDCLELLPKFIESKSLDMIFCDLPYGTTKCKWDSVIDLPNLWEEYERVIKDDGVILLFAQTTFDKVLGSSNLQLLRYEWIWEKTNATGHLNSKKMPMKAHENMLVFYKSPPTYNPQKTKGHKRKVSLVEHKYRCKESEIYNQGQKLTSYDSTERYPRSVQLFASDTQKSKLHPTQKPLALIEYMIRTYSNENDLILDNACGSGTTGLGAKNLGRNYIMMELDPKYYQIARERLES